MDIGSCLPDLDDVPTGDDAGSAILHSVLATVPDAVVVIDDQGMILSFSRAAERMFGIPEHQAIGRNIAMLAASPDDERQDGLLERFRRLGEHRIFGGDHITSARHGDGSIFPIELAVGEAMTPQGRVFTGVIRDMTSTGRADRRLQDLQLELANAARVSAVGTLAAALAHELNQPLAAIANYVEGARTLIARQPGEQQSLNDALEQAAAQSLRAGQIVRRLRDFIARGASTRAVHSLATLVAEATMLTGIGMTAVAIRIDLDPESDAVLVDGMQVQQVLLSLIRNALEALDGAPLKQLAITARPMSEQLVEIIVADSGTGLSAEAEATLFEPFRSSKDNGMGLDLSICRTIIEAHGGRIRTAASPLGGTAFRFTLPRATNNG
jgi:two-component system sensor kinase FixL